MRAIEASLRRLRTDHVDLYQLHAWDRHTPIDESLQALDDLVHAGKVRYAGISNLLAYQLARSLGRSEVLGVARFESLQPRYNLLFRQPERELLPAVRRGAGRRHPLQPPGRRPADRQAPREGSPTEGTRFTLGNAAERYTDRYWHDREFATVEALRAVADDAGRSMAELAVGWVLANPVITSPILGASRPEQLADAVRAARSPLEPDLKARLDELTAEYRSGDAER